MNRLTAMVAMLALMLAMPVVAYAADALRGSVKYVDCNRVQLALTQQVNAFSDQDVAGLAQSTEVSHNQVSLRVPAASRAAAPSP